MVVTTGPELELELELELEHVLAPELEHVLASVRAPELELEHVRELELELELAPELALLLLVVLERPEHCCKHPVHDPQCALIVAEDILYIHSSSMGWD